MSLQDGLVCSKLCKLVPMVTLGNGGAEGNNCGLKERGLLTACAATWLYFPYRFIKMSHIRSFFIFPPIEHGLSICMISVEVAQG